MQAISGTILIKKHLSSDAKFCSSFFAKEFEVLEKRSAEMLRCGQRLLNCSHLCRPLSTSSLRHSSLLTLERPSGDDEGLAIIRLNKADTMNALSKQMLKQVS